MTPRSLASCIEAFVLASLCTASLVAAAAGQDLVVVGGEGRNCSEDPQCINRIHPAIPMAATATSGQRILFKTRNASDFDLDPESTFEDPRADDPMFGTVHPLTGPVDIEGAQAGDVLAVRILDIDPGRWGWTIITAGGFVTDQISGSIRAEWLLDRSSATSDELPGIRVPNASFPGVISVLPSIEQHAAMLSRETLLAEHGGAVLPPHPAHATPAAICGPEGSHKDECLRTIPPREHGGNMDIRHLGVGVTVYLPCAVDGCGLTIGDLHYAQGDGEVSGTAIEMDADVLVEVELIKDGRKINSPHYEGPASLLDIPSRTFYATTGFPFKEVGSVPPDMAYLDSPNVAALPNLSKDISLAARNALLEMIDHIATTYGFSRQQAYLIASIAVDLRIGQLVDAPNVGVTAILPLDIFVEP